MTREGSETAIVTSALVMTGVYTYRRLTESSSESGKQSKLSAKSTVEGMVGRGELLPTGAWVIGMGVSFIAISILGSASPNAGGYGAILLATSRSLATV